MTEMDTTHGRWRRSLHVVSRQVAGETLLIPIRGRLADMQRIFAIDPVAAHVWDLLSEPRTLDDMVERVTASFEVTVADAHRDVGEFLDSLAAAGLIEAV